MEPDPLQYGTTLLLESVYYPLGYPLHLATNSEQVLRAAARSWGEFQPAFDVAPLRVRVAVSPGAAPAAPPTYAGQENLMIIASDSAHVAACDSSRAFAYCRLSDDAASDPAYTSYYFLEAMAYHLLTQLYITPVHAACVCRHGRGVLLCGATGAGKSSLAYACAQRGWTYVSDNESWLVRQGGPPLLLGNPHRIRFRDTAVELFPELRAFTPSLHANGKLSIDLRTTSLPGMAGISQCRVDFLVLLDRRPGDAEMVQAGPEAALRTLRAAVPLYEPQVRREHEASLARLVESPVVTLRYDSLDAAVERLEALVRTP